MAYILGFFAADGYITVNKRGGQFWSIQITDKELLEEIKRVIEAEHKIGVRMGSGNESTLYRLQIGSIEMCEDLRSLGFYERKTKSLAVPNVPQMYFADFVRGYFDGDGNAWVGKVNKERKTPSLTLMTMFTSCSIEFLKVLHKRLNFCGLDGGTLYVSKRNYSRLQFSVRNSLKLYDFMYNHRSHLKSGLFLNRKKEVFEKYGKLRKLRS